ncbi:MAG: hypothetical protein ACK4GC_09560, partial [Paracoccaceae bacterium]
VVFLTFGDTQDGRLHLSLISFAHHAGRALTAHPAEFAVIPIHQPMPPGAFGNASATDGVGLRGPRQMSPDWHTGL